MNETLEEFLRHFFGKDKFNYIYVDNLTDNIADKYTLEELDNYGHYKVLEWEYRLYDEVLSITIER